MHIAASGGTFAATIKLLLRRWKYFHGVNEILKLFIESFSDGSNTILSNFERTQTSFFEHRINSNVFIY